MVQPLAHPGSWSVCVPVSVSLPACLLSACPCLCLFVCVRVCPCVRLFLRVICVHVCRLTLTKLKSAGISEHKGEGTCNYMAPELFLINGQQISEFTVRPQHSQGKREGLREGRRKEGGRGGGGGRERKRERERERERMFVIFIISCLTLLLLLLLL